MSPLDAISLTINRLENCAPLLVADEPAILLAEEIARLKEVHDHLQFTPAVVLFKQVGEMKRKLEIAEEIISLIQCRIDDTRSESGRMAMTCFCRDRMEALEVATARYRAVGGSLATPRGRAEHRGISPVDSAINP